MQILLEKTGGQVSALHGALHNFLSLDSRNGYAQGYLNNFNIFLSASNAVSVDTGMLYISGFRVQNNDLFTETIPTLPSTPIRMQLIAILDVKLAAETSTCTFLIRPVQILRQDNIFRFGNGIYELELARFTAQTGGIVDFVKTIDPLIGVSGGGGLIVGNVTTETLEPGMDAEVDVEQREDEETGEIVTDFSFAIPTGAQGPQGPRGLDGHRIWPIVSYILNISAVPGAVVGDYFLNAGLSTINILGVSTARGGIVRSTSATAGSYNGSILGATGIPGETGPAGADGINGIDGSDGRSTWIKYNTFPQDAGATITWSEGQNYIGIQSVVATAHPTSGYTWSKFIHEAEKQIRSATVIVGFTDDCDFNITKLGTLNNAQATINNALLTLPTAGGKVILREGTYNITGSIVIRRPYVTIEGMGISTELKRMANFTQGIFRFQYANNKLEKCYINGNGMQGSGIEVFAYSNIITGNICKNNNIAINVPGSNNTITGNICDENSFISILNVGNENAITNNVCRASSIGIHIEQGGAITISSNTCIGNIRGIVIEEGITNITVTANTCIYCEQAGINTLGSQITITGNTFSSSNVGILLENGEVNTITGNCCCENNDCGIRLYNCSNNTITGNNCGQSYIGIEIGGYASYYNLIVGNTLYCTVPYSDYGHGTWIRINKNGSANIGA